MKKGIFGTGVILLVILGAVFGTAINVIASNDGEKRIHACVNKKHGFTRIIRETGICFKPEVKVTWPFDIPSANLPLITTDRAFGSGFGELGNETVLIDTNDGSILKSYGSSIHPINTTVSCDGTRALIEKDSDILLVDTSTGDIIATYDEGGSNRVFSCSRLEVLNKGFDVVMNRAAISQGGNVITKLIDTDNGAIIGEYPGTSIGFNCTGDLLSVGGEGAAIVNAITGEIILFQERSIIVFSC